MSAPERIWVYGPDTTGFSHKGYDTRSMDPSVEYILADLYEAQAQRIAELEKRNAVLEYRIDSAISFLPQDRRDQYYASLKRTQQP